MSEKKAEKKVFFLTRQKEFIQANLVSETHHNRVIKVTEKGHNLSGKELKVHPKGVAWGNLYPRVFECDEKPTGFFDYKGRVMLRKDGPVHDLAPEVESYHFQPVTIEIVDSIIANDNVLLTGEAGTGKTTHIEQIASRTNQPVTRVNMNGETRITDFLGKTEVISGPNGSITKWVDGVLPTAMRKGYWLICDELDMAEPNILSLLHPVLEPNGKLVLKENNGEVIKPHKNFRLFATANSIGTMSDRADAYAGANEMNEAFMDRWQVLEMPYLDAKTEIKVIRQRVPQLKSKWAKNIVQLANQVRNGVGNDDGTALEMTFSTRRVLKWAEKMALYRSPIKGANSAFLNHISKDDKKVMVRLIGLTFGKSGKTKAGEVSGVKDETKPQNKAEREFWKSLSNGKRGRVSKEVHDEKVEKLKEFRRKNASG